MAWPSVPGALGGEGMREGEGVLLREERVHGGDKAHAHVRAQGWVRVGQRCVRWVIGGWHWKGGSEGVMCTGKGGGWGLAVGGGMAALHRQAEAVDHRRPGGVLFCE